MAYLDTSTDEVRKAVTPAGWEGTDFYEEFPQEKFDKLLSRLEKDSRSIIDGQLMGEGLEEETGRVDKYEAPDKEKIQLAYPVNDVSKVEIRTGTDSSGNPEWDELEDSLYRNTEQFVVYKGRVNQTFKESVSYQNKNSLKRYSNSASWADRCTQVKITYDRGFSTIPNQVKEVQKEIIRRMLTHLRQEQNLAKVDPTEVSSMVNERRLLTEDIKDRIGKITQGRHKYTMIG